MAGKILRVFTYLYLFGGIFSLYLIPASAFGWLGIVQDPLSGIFALLFGLPWTLLLNLSEATNLYFSFFVAAAGIAVNTLILLWLSRRFYQ